MTGPDLAADLAAWHEIAGQLREAVVEAVPGWMHRSVGRVINQQRIEAPDGLDHWLAEATERCCAFVDRDLEALFACDPDEQRGTPLGVLRNAVRFPSEVLDRAGAKSVVRGDVDRWAVPNDHYNLSPGNMADLSERAHELSIAWGAGKAHIHLKRRRKS